MRRVFVVVCALASLSSSPVRSAGAKAEAPIPLVKVDVAAPVVFDKHVFPILAEKCITCHDREGGLAESDLDLLTVTSILEGGKRGPAIVKGKGAESLMVKLASHAAKPHMPPKGEEPLTSKELSVIKLWIDRGAKPGENLNPIESMAQEVVLGQLPPGVHPVYALDLDNAGVTLAAGRANQVFVYDVSTGGLRAQLTGHEDIVQSVKLSPDGKWLASGGYRTVKLWKIPVDSEVGKLEGHDAPVKSLAVSPDGKRAATAAGAVVRLWDPATRKVLRKFDLPAAASAVAFGPKGQLLAVGCADKQIRVYADDGALQATLRGAPGEIATVAIGGDGKWIAACATDNDIRLWHLSTERTPKKDGEHKGATKKGEAKSDAAKKAETKKAEPKKDESKDDAGKKETARQAEGNTEPESAPPTLEPARTLSGHSKPVRQVAFAKGRLFSASDDGTLRVWSPADGKQTASVNHGSAIAALAVSPDGSLMASAGADRQVKVWKVADGSLTATIPIGDSKPTALAFGPAKQLALGADDGKVRVWHAETRQLLHVFSGHGAAVNGVGFTGDALASASDDKTARLWSLAGKWGEPQDIGPFEDRVAALDFSPDGKLLAVGGGAPAASGELVIWDREANKPLCAIEDAHSDTVFSVAFSPDGKLLASTSADRFLKVHEVATGKFQKSFEGHTHHVLSVAWKADGKQLATAGADNAIKVWNYETGEQIRTIGGHSKQVTGVTWVGKTANLASSCADRQARLINADNGRITRGFGGANDFLYCVDASADGKLIVAGGHEGKVFVWDASNGKLLRTFAVSGRQ